MEEACKMGVPVLISTDAHHFSEISLEMGSAGEALKKLICVSYAIPQKKAEIIRFATGLASFPQSYIHSEIANLPCKLLIPHVCLGLKVNKLFMQA